MNKEVLNKVKEIIDLVEKQEAQSRADKKLIENLDYWLKGQGVKTQRGERKSALYDKQMKSSAKESTFRGSLQDSIAERERKLRLEEERKKLAVQKEEEEEAQEEDKQVLANSEEKPKRKRRTTRKKKTDDK